MPQVNKQFFVGLVCGLLLTIPTVVILFRSCITFLK